MFWNKLNHRIVNHRREGAWWIGRWVFRRSDSSCATKAAARCARRAARSRADRHMGVNGGALGLSSLAGLLVDPFALRSSPASLGDRRRVDGSSHGLSRARTRTCDLLRCDRHVRHHGRLLDRSRWRPVPADRRHNPDRLRARADQFAAAIPFRPGHRLDEQLGKDADVPGEGRWHARSVPPRPAPRHGVEPLRRADARGRHHDGFAGEVSAIPRSSWSASGLVRPCRCLPLA